MQDEDILWRRAFADSMGLFDNLSYGPLPTCPIHNSHLPSTDSMVHSASPPSQDQFLAQPPTGNINAALAPSPALSFTSPVAQQALLPCPTLVGSSPMAELPPLAPHPAPSTTLGAVGGLGSPLRASNEGDAPVQLQQSEAVSAAQAAARQMSDDEAHQASPGPGKHGDEMCFFLLVAVRTANKPHGWFWRLSQLAARKKQTQETQQTKQQQKDKRRKSGMLLYGMDYLASGRRGARGRARCNSPFASLLTRIGAPGCRPVSQ